MGRKSLLPSWSTSPRAHIRYLRWEEPHGWLYNPLIECVVHCSTECSMCGEYSAHLNNAAMDNNQSYIDAVSKKNAYFVPITQWQAEVKKTADTREDRYCYCNHAHKAKVELDDLHITVHDLEKQLEVAKGQSFASTAARVASKPLTHVKPHAPIESPTGQPVVKLFILLNTVKERKAPAPLVPAVAATAAPSPDKSKGHVAPTIVGDPYADALSYDDSEWDDLNVDTSKEDAQARESLIFRQVTAVLSGTSLSVPNGSGSTFVEGRVMDIFPKTMAEFRLMYSTLEQVHSENNPNMNDLLQIIHRYVGLCHKSTCKTDLQKSVIDQWRVPDWAEAVKYNHIAQAVVSTGMTKMDRINQKVSGHSVQGSAEHAQLQLDLAKQLGLMVTGKPHPHLGNLSSPRHEDHPELWRLWSRTVATIKPKGLIPGPDSMAYKRAVRGFHLLAPMIKDTGASAKAKEKDDVHRACQYHGQITLMMVVVRSRHYDQILARE